MAADAQAIAALALANEIRLERAELKRRIKAGEITVAEVLADPPRCVESMRVIDLVRAQHRYGYRRAGRVVTDAMVPHTRTVGGLTANQTARLIATVERFGRRGRNGAAG